MDSGEEKAAEPTFKREEFDQGIARLANEHLLAALDLALLELERRLYRYARVGADLQDMADEGLVLASRAGARLAQAQSAAAHTQGHLQLVGVGDWRPTSTRPAWNEDPRVGEEPDDGAAG